jgi:hypothetical protein
MGHAPLPASAFAAAPAACAEAPDTDNIAGLWRGHDLARTPRPGIATGFASLDAELPGGGWPAGALTEVLHGQSGIGEMRLLFPALGALARSGAPVFLLEPPWIPYAPAFADGGIPLNRLIIVRPRKPADLLWACEQILKGLSDGALLAWPRHLKAQEARRLQLAVEGKSVLAVLMRPSAAVNETTPAALRIAIEAVRPAADPPSAHREELRLRILKRRGGVLARSIVLHPPSPLFPRPAAPPLPSLPADVVDRTALHAPAPRLHPASA